MTKQRTERSFAVLFITALVLAACSGSERAGPDAEPATEQTGSAASATTPEPPDAQDAPPATDGSEPAPEPVDTTATDATITTTTGDAGAGAGEPEARYLSGDSGYLFDQEQLHTFEIDLPEEALAELDADPAAEEYVEGSLTFDGETIAPIGVRYKGSIGAFIFCTAGPNPFQPSGPKTCTKLSLKLKINWDDSNAEFFGVRRVQLHSQNLDPTKMHERLGYWVFREMGVPAPRSTHARVIVNGEYLGVFALTEQIDGRFTRENFEDGTGNLYKEVWPFDADGDPRDGDAFIDGLKTNEDENPTADIIASFAAELAAAAPQDALDVVDKWSDVDALLRAFVVDRAIKNDDGALHWYCLPECNPHNFYWYEDPSEQQVSFIPWDLDNAFDNLQPDGFAGAITRIADRWGEASNDCEPFPFGPAGLEQRSAACDPLIAALATLDEDYDRIRAELLAGPLAANRVREQLDAWTEQIRSAVDEEFETHPDDGASVSSWVAAIDELTQDLDDARATDGR